jgi:4-carboxymuconolactone decarboxylase
MKTEDPAFIRGREIRAEMFGPAGLAGLDQADEFQQPLQDAVTRLCFGEVWDRPGLDRKTRSMITIAILCAMSRPNQLKNHVRGAIGNGVTKEEIMEVLLHSMTYVGIPAGTDSWQQATAALKEIDAY